MLKTRIRTAVVLIIIFIPILWFSYIPYVSQGLGAALAGFSMWEMLHACGLHKKLWLLIPAEILAVGLPFTGIPGYSLILTFLYPVMLLVFLYTMLNMDADWLRKPGMAVLYIVTVLLCSQSVPLLRLRDNGLWYYLFVIAASIGTDTAAYFVGSAIGKHKLAPDVSPKKSIEGSLGGIAASVVLMILLGVLLQFAFGKQVNYSALVFYGAAASVAGQIGDLSMSTVKRVHGIKDYSNLLPGHGGILDRFDSIFFAAPFTLLFVQGVNIMIG